MKQVLLPGFHHLRKCLDWKHKMFKEFEHQRCWLDFQNQMQTLSSCHLCFTKSLLKPVKHLLVYLFMLFTYIYRKLTKQSNPSSAHFLKQAYCYTCLFVVNLPFQICVGIQSWKIYKYYGSNKIINHINTSVNYLY